MQNTITMQYKSIRPFIGARDFDVSRKFYSALGFEEKELGSDMSLFTFGALSFYLQKAYVKDWVDNTMVFVEVDDVEKYWEKLNSLHLLHQFTSVRLTPIRYEAWGKECFVHDPSGILWHFGEFN
mgnify:CR=1 FL=1